MPPPPPPESFTPARLEALTELTHYRWAIPLIAECGQSPVLGWKYVTLLHRLQISRDSLGRTLAALIAQGRLMHNPGVGHALRPEYVLTPAGARLVPAASALLLAATNSSALDTALDKWSLPVLVSLTSGPRRFAELRTLLPRATPRALVLALDSLEAARLVRHVQPRGSAHAVYQLNPRGRRLAHAASDLMSDIGLRLPSPATPDDQSPSASANGSGAASKTA